MDKDNSTQEKVASLLAISLVATWLIAFMFYGNIQLELKWSKRCTTQEEFFPPKN